MSECLVLEEVVKVYPGAQVPAVAGVSLTLHRGEILALLGPNGAGKTTTVKMIGGLILPTSGRITLLGKDVVQERRAAVRHIGAVLEGARNLYWRLPAAENLRYFGSLRGAPSHHLSRRIDELLHLMELETRGRQEVRHFSRGMQQKLAIAAALIHDPQVLLLDEPTLGLDVHAAQRIEAIVRQMAREQGKAILLTTHTMPLAERLADRIFVMDHGRQVVYDTTQRLLDQFNGRRQTIEIEVAGALSPQAEERIRSQFADVSITITAASDQDPPSALLRWPDGDQKRLLRLLLLLDEEACQIVNVTRRRATLEEIFLSLTETGAR